MCVCMCIHMQEGDMKKNIFEAKYIIQRNTENWGKKKKKPCH